MTTIRKCLHFAIAMIALLGAAVWRANGAPLNPQVAWTQTITGAGPVVYDGTYGWVGTSTGDLVAVNKSGGIVATQVEGVGAIPTLRYDNPLGNLWFIANDVALGSSEACVVNTTAIFDNEAVTECFAFDGAVTDITIDLQNRVVYVASNGTIYAMQCHAPYTVLNTITAPDGHPVTSLARAYNASHDGFWATTTYYVGGYGPFADVYFYDRVLAKFTWSSTTTELTFGGPVFPVWDGYASELVVATQTSLTTIDNEYGNVAYYYLFDSADSSYATGPVTGASYDATTGVAAVVTGVHTTLIPTQVYVFYATTVSDNGVPGVGVAGAVNVTSAGDLIWVSGGNTLTAISYTT